MVVILVLVANRTRARLFKVADPDGSLEEVDTLTHPGGRLHRRELRLDRSGCTFERVGDVRYAKEPAVNGKEHESMTFAGQVADWLETVCREEQIPALALIAGPAFLGMLRDKLDSHARPFVRWERDKNYYQPRSVEDADISPCTALFTQLTSMFHFRSMFSGVRVALPEKSEAANVRKIGGAYKSPTSATRSRLDRLRCVERFRDPGFCYPWKREKCRRQHFVFITILM
jgi:protein required for attachment to host cells